MRIMSYNDAVKDSKNGVMLQLHVVPGSSQSIFPAGYNEWRKALEIKVSTEAKDNKATAEVLKTIASFFHLPEKDVVLQSGQKSRQKTVCLKNIQVDKVLQMLGEFVHE
jgi:uncharacterized protein